MTHNKNDYTEYESNLPEDLAHVKQAIHKDADQIEYDEKKSTISDIRNQRVIQYMTEIATPGSGNAEAERKHWPRLNPTILTQYKRYHDKLLGITNTQKDDRNMAA